MGTGPGLPVPTAGPSHWPEGVNWECANDGRAQITVDQCPGSPRPSVGMAAMAPLGQSPRPGGKRRFLSVPAVQLQLSLQVSNLGSGRAELKAALREMVSASLCSASPTPPGHLCGVVAALQGNSCSSRVRVLPVR